LTRSGSRKIRAIVPPDDIRHRMLRWNKAEQMWEERQIADLNPDFGGSRAVRQKFMGCNGHTKRLGSAMSLRENQTAASYDKANKKEKSRPGPYMPVVLQACEEGSYAYEYHHGAISYGVFSYALAKEFRKAMTQGPRGISFNALRDRVNATMKDLRYDQVCAADGPTTVCAGPVLPAPRKKQTATRRRR